MKKLHSFEHQAPQRILFDIDLYVALAETTPARDTLDEVVDNDFVREVIKNRIRQGHIQLQETLCDELVTLLLAHQGVKAVQLSSRKPDAYSDCGCVGVEVWKAK